MKEVTLVESRPESIQPGGSLVKGGRKPVDWSQISGTPEWNKKVRIEVLEGIARTRGGSEAAIYAALGEGLSRE